MASTRGTPVRSAQFVLSVWNQGADWSCGRFDAVRALYKWDHAHRSAFARWAVEPFGT